MPLQVRVCRHLAIASVILLPTVVAAQAQTSDYPNRNPRIVVGYPAGGATDIVARIFGDWLSKRLGQQFIVENRPGAGNNLATDGVIRSPADGYTFILTNPANTVNASLYKKLSFNFIRDTDPVAGFVRVPNVMEVHPSVPVKTVKEFIEYVKANPGKVNMASSGNGTSIHLSGMLFMNMTGIQMTHVPYRGSAPALTDLLAGQVHVMFDNLPPSMQHIKAGTLRPLAVTTAQRSPELPDVPTVGDTVPGYEASAFFGLSAPKGTPPEIVNLINREVNLALKDPEILAKLKNLGGIPIPGTPEDFGKIIASETDKWEKVVRAADLSVE
ncbi:MAG: tripartite tricarboxylate transporter substrate binding protein [Pseudorhodoplanes sp.]